MQHQIQVPLRMRKLDLYVMPGVPEVYGYESEPIRVRSPIAVLMDRQIRLIYPGLYLAQVRRIGLAVVVRLEAVRWHRNQRPLDLKIIGRHVFVNAVDPDEVNAGAHPVQGDTLIVGHTVSPEEGGHVVGTAVQLHIQVAVRVLKADLDVIARPSHPYRGELEPVLVRRPVRVGVDGQILDRRHRALHRPQVRRTRRIIVGLVRVGLRHDSEVRDEVPACHSVARRPRINRRRKEIVVLPVQHVASKVRDTGAAVQPDSVRVEGQRARRRERCHEVHGVIRQGTQYDHIVPVAEHAVAAAAEQGKRRWRHRGRIEVLAESHHHFGHLRRGEKRSRRRGHVDHLRRRRVHRQLVQGPVITRVARLVRRHNLHVVHTIGQGHDLIVREDPGRIPVVRRPIGIPPNRHVDQHGGQITRERLGQRARQGRTRILGE